VFQTIKLLKEGKVMQTLDEMKDEQLRQEWNSSEALRTEFVNDYALFAAAKRAEVRGVSSQTRRVVEGGQ
jgi:hypothetical protein